MTLTSSYFMLVHKMRGVGAIKTPIHFRRSTGVLAAKFKGVISELGGKKKKYIRQKAFCLSDFLSFVFFSASIYNLVQRLILFTIVFRLSFAHSPLLDFFCSFFFFFASFFLLATLNRRWPRGNMAGLIPSMIQIPAVIKS